MVGRTFRAKIYGIQGVDEYLSYKDFEIYFPQWKLPSEGLGENKIREYIFAHYQ